jgi:signal transduction histidine kinase
VDHRLFFLVGCETVILILLVLIAVRTLSNAFADYEHMYTFQFQSVAAIGEAIQNALTMREGVPSEQLDEFYERYRKEWETASGTTPDAIRFRNDLRDAGATELPRQETEVLDDLQKNLKTANPTGVLGDLEALYNLNVTYARLENEYVTKRFHTARIELIALGAIGVIGSAFLGAYVRSSVGPRIQRLARHVRDFRDKGWTERIVDNGNDDITVLSNALDIGLSAIASRQRDRDQFLAIVAHELKTPVTSIYGYASLLLRNPKLSPQEMERPIEAINRQSWRLSRLIDALFLTEQARAGQLQFQPKPLNISELVDLVIREMEPLFPKNVFQTQIDPDITILGDEVLLEHAIWALVASSAAFSKEDAPIALTFHKFDSRARLAIDIREPGASAAELQELFTPFRFVEYETGRGVRSAIGLYLCREIVRLHNGTLRVEYAPGIVPELVMELPT